MRQCKKCTNYVLNRPANVNADNVCMGEGDCRKCYFTCNQDYGKAPEIIRKETVDKTATNPHKVEAKKLEAEVSWMKGILATIIKDREKHCYGDDLIEDDAWNVARGALAHLNTKYPNV